MRCRKWLAWGWFSLAAAGGAFASPEALRASKPEVRKQIVTTIEAQLAAFRRNDLPAAFRFFAPELQAEKPLPLFAAIVRANYPEFLGNTRAEFGIVRDDGVSATVLVHVFAKTSDASYDYTLIKEGGRWLVHGVVRHKPLKEEQVDGRRNRGFAPPAVRTCVLRGDPKAFTTS